MPAYRYFIATFLTAFLVVAPVKAQESETITISTPADSAVHAVGRFKLVESGNGSPGRRYVSAEIENEHGEIVKFTCDPKHVTFGDGFDVAIAPVSQSQAEIIVKLTVTNPAGEAAISVIRFDKVNQTIAPISGAAKTRDLLSQSHDFAATASALPLLVSAFETARSARTANAQVVSTTSSTKHMNVGNQDLAPDIDASFWGCIGAGLAVIATGLALIAACAIPEPLEPIACLGAVFAYLSAVVIALDTCFG